MSNTQVLGNCSPIQCKLKSRVHMKLSLIAWSNMLCFSETFATFKGESGCYWIREQLLLIIWLSIYLNYEVRIINFPIVLSVLCMTLKSGALYVQNSWELINFPIPLSVTGQDCHKCFEALRQNIACQNLNARFETPWVWLTARFRHVSHSLCSKCRSCCLYWQLWVTSRYENHLTLKQWRLH